MVLKKVVAALLLLLLLLKAALALPKDNDSIVGHVAHREDGVVLVYNNIPCSKDILRLVPARHQTGWKGAKFITPDGVSLKGCWALYGDSKLLIWEDKTYGRMSTHEFRLLRET